MKPVVGVLLLAAIWGKDAQAAGPPACRPLRPAPVAAASAVEIRLQPELSPALPEPVPQPPESWPAESWPAESSPAESSSADPGPIPGDDSTAGPDTLEPGAVGRGTAAPAPYDPNYLQRVDPAPWAYMKCIPPAPCRTPCYADCIPCEARMFRSTAPKCHHQAFHLSIRDAVWNALDLPHAMHECCRKIHNTYFTPNPYARPYPYEQDCD